ncbi:MAG: hypothetical protein SGJ10_04325 [Bacteroidota bacterium]|nr:hypothetical protein [Bacteroidota bacterium]
MVSFALHVTTKAQYWIPSNSVTTATLSPVSISIPTPNTNTTNHFLIRRNLLNVIQNPPPTYYTQNYLRIENYTPPILGFPAITTPIFTINDDGYIGLGVNDPTSPLHVSIPFDYNFKSFHFTNNSRPSNILIIGGQTPPYDRQLFYVNRLFQGSYGKIPQTDDQGIFWSDGKTKATNVSENVYDETGEITGTRTVTNYYNTSSGFVIAPWYNPTNTSDFRGLRIANNGFVSINSSNNFGYALAVNGTIGAKEIELDIAINWPDYVFDSSYQLYDIDSLRHYINANHHLPGIPPASKMQDQKMNVAEMNIALLKKIEEMTLYMIQLEERIKKVEGK